MTTTILLAQGGEIKQLLSFPPVGAMGVYHVYLGPGGRERGKPCWGAQKPKAECFLPAPPLPQFFRIARYLGVGCQYSVDFRTVAIYLGEAVGGEYV